jgi:hypothetical protein
VRWSEYVPDGLLADMLAHPADTDPEHREFEALERIGAWERVVAWVQANQLRQMASFMRSAQARNAALGASTSQAHESAVAEVGLMLRVSARTAAARVGGAWSLCTRMPATLTALEQGRITLDKARILDAETLNLSREHTALVEQQVLAKARQQTPGQLRAATRRAVLNTDPSAAQKRAEQARRERGCGCGRSLMEWPPCRPTCPPRMPWACSRSSTSTRATPGCLVTNEPWRLAAATLWSIWCSTPPGGALAAPAPLVTTPPTSPVTTPPTSPAATRAPQIPQAPVPRAPVPQDTPTTTLRPRPFPLRGAAAAPAGSAGAAGAWISGSPSPTPRCWVLMSCPASLPATGRSPAAVARDLAAGGTWRRILTDPASGRPVDYGTTRYQPPAHLAGLVITRDQTCQFPGCRVPAHRCDLDHGVPYDPATGTGPTSDINLGPKCRRHHQVKQTPGWSVTQHPDGATTWITPSGHRYHSQPPPLTDPEPLTTHPVPDPDQPPPF